MTVSPTYPIYDGSLAYISIAAIAYDLAGAVVADIAVSSRAVL